MEVMHEEVLKYLHIYSKSLQYDGSGAVPGDIRGVWNWKKGLTFSMTVLGPPSHGEKN